MTIDTQHIAKRQSAIDLWKAAGSALVLFDSHQAARCGRSCEHTFNGYGALETNFTDESWRFQLRCIRRGVIAFRKGRQTYGLSSLIQFRSAGAIVDDCGEREFVS